MGAGAVGGGALGRCLHSVLPGCNTIDQPPANGMLGAAEPTFAGDRRIGAGSLAEAPRRRRAQEPAYRFMSSLADDRPRFEDATRALFAGDAAARRADRRLAR
jgi:hypothetical protein